MKRITGNQNEPFREDDYEDDNDYEDDDDIDEFDEMTSDNDDSTESQDTETIYIPEHDITEKLSEFKISQGLDGFIAQTRIKNHLKICIASAKKRGEVLDHVLIYGSSGIGKAALAKSIAREMGVNICVTSSNEIKKAGDLVAKLTNLANNDVLFIDDIHCLSPYVCQELCMAMDNKRLDIIIGKGPSAQTIQMPLPDFTLIGATSSPELLSGSLMNCFGILLKSEPFNNDELAEIIRGLAEMYGICIDFESSLRLAEHSNSSPQIANRLLRRLRDYAEVYGVGRIDRSIIDKALDSIIINEFSL